MTVRLGGWLRIGIVASVLWAVLVVAYAVFEMNASPESPMLLTEMAVSKTGEPATVLKDNQFRDLVPVEPRLRIQRFLAVIVAPVIVAWGLAYLGVSIVRWVAAGFRRNDT
jgi:hypothetical protein